MTPFLQFRVWLRRGPTGERALGGVAALLVVALAAWALVPVDDPAETTDVTAGVEQPVAATGDVVTAPGEAANPGDAEPGAAEVALPGPDLAGTGTSDSSAGAPSSAGAAAPAAGAGGSGGGRGAVAGGSAPAAGGNDDPCAGAGATDQGVTKDEIFIAVSLVNLGGDVGNETFGIRADLEAVANAAAAGVNAEGGVACRKLRIKTYRVNPLNQSEQRSRCLEIVGDKPFAVLDYAAYLDPVARSCFAQNKLLYQPVTSVTEEEAAGAQPYMYSALASTDRQLRNWVFEAAARGTFKSKEFRKLGLLLNACNPKVNKELRGNLAKVGVREVSTFTLRCATVAPPNEISQAVLQHRQDGVSHVLLAAPVGNAQSYVRNADGLGWRPSYQATDFGSVTISTSEGGWNDGFDGAIGITSNRGGELNSSIVHPQVARCQGWMKRARVRPPDRDGDAALGLCDMFTLFRAAANANGPQLVRTRVVPSLAKVGRVDFAAFGVGVYNRPGKVTAGDFLRAVQWRAGCKCWRVIDRELKPAH